MKLYRQSLSASQVAKKELQNLSVRGSNRIALWIFFTLFLTYAFFHQGGGWNQNSRFDQIRAIIENQQLEINEFLLYRSEFGPSGGARFARLAVPKNADLASVLPWANTADVSVFAGNIYPNKPPGTVLLASPAYGIIYAVESLVGADPDMWWVMTVNAYLTTVFSVGFFTALGAVFFYLVSLRLFPSSPSWTHIASTLTYGLGTLVLPFATLLFDHNLVASFTIIAFWLLVVERQGGFASLRSSFAIFLAGLLSGLAVTVNYTALISASALIFYGMGYSRRKSRFLLCWSAGVVGPTILLLWYHFVCFGSAFASANTHQFGGFRSEAGFVFGMFGMPRLSVLAQLLFSSYRGLFFSSPVLVMSICGLHEMVIIRRQFAEALLVAGIFGAYLLLNASFNHWHSGWSVGPRYLIPAIPFLSLPMAPVFERWWRTTVTLAGLSVVIMIVVTSVDPQPPSSTANPIRDHILALAMGEELAINHVVLDSPVSANPIGFQESWARPAESLKVAERKWQSFNLGEFLWPGSFWSLAPLGLFLGVGCLIFRKYMPRAPSSTRFETS